MAKTMMLKLPIHRLLWESKLGYVCQNPGGLPGGLDNSRIRLFLLSLALYGHPLAGLFRGKHIAKLFLERGFEPVKGWECLYVHRNDKLFLSVYVDDFKMAGKA